MFKKEQQKHIQKVLQYIDENLHEELPLEKLAKVSTYSAYHFQRTFKAMTGETPASYIKRLRLENAAHYLIYEQQLPVTQIAYLCGFSSLSYFTYSFQKYFKTSPKKWRDGLYLERFPREYEDSKKSKLVSTYEEEERDSNAYNEFRWLDLTKVKTVEMPACVTVNRQRVGSYTRGIPETWEELYHWANARDLFQNDRLLLGVPKSNPYITPPEKSRYDCRIEMASDEISGLEDEVIYPFKGGKHVIYEFDEPVDYRERGKLIECYSELYSYWLPRSGYRYLGNPVEWVNMAPVPGSLSVACKVKAIGLAIEPK